MAHAGMSTMKAEVRLFTDETHDLFKLGDGSDHRKVEHNGAAACFMGIEGATAWFGCETHNLPDSETMVGIMGHEVAHAFRSLKGITREDRALEEYLTDITTIYLGFGIFTANGSHQYTSSGEQYGTTTIMRWSHRRLGYLPTAAMCFLLASQVVARGSTLWERARLARLLRPNQRGYFTDTVRDIIGRRAELLAMLKCT